MPDIIGSIIGAATTNWQNNKQRQFDRSMAEYAYSKDLNMWNLANEYNAPQQQMQRFEDAGLNKNLIYSQGQPGQAASSMPKYQDVKGTFGGFPTPDVGGSITSLINGYQDWQLKRNQTDLLKTQVDTANYDNQLKKIEYEVQTGTRLPDQDEYGYLWGKPKESTGKLSTADYDLNAKEAETLKRQREAISLGISNQWQQKKLDTMNQSNINIDHDSILNRYIADIFGKLIQKYSGKLSSILNKTF